MEFHRLVGLRDSRRPVKGHPSSLYMDSLRSCIVFFFRPRRILCALQIELNFTAANDILAVFFILAAMRVYDVMPLAGFSKNCDLDVFEDACRILLEVRRLRSFHGEELLGSY